MRKAILKKILKGKFAGQIRFVLKGDNGETVGTGEQYTTKQSAVKTLNKYFPDFPIDDQTK